ncbi:MAG: 50S ribosomal protein L24 [Phycisphaeraceae bacterium]|nr:MAG: 50S ribosomal protein L24 [Phycisphaeraceae bacterium]
MPRHVRTGDTVIINSGDQRGKTGEVIRVDTARDRVYVKGVNLRTKHMRPTRINPQGGVITKEAPIHISNVSPVADGKPTRVRFEAAADGGKKRIAVRTGKALPVVVRRSGGERGKADTV